MTTSPPSFLIYGATGFTAGLIIAEAKLRGYMPVLAGRDGTRMAALGKKHALPVRVFDLERPDQIGKHLNDIEVVLHCAGPFSETALPMLQGCMRAGAHYLDITGEIEVFEAMHARSQEIADAGVAAISGVGFDVVPTDCLAARLAEKLPGAMSLTLAFAAEGGMSVSRGTARTMITHMHKGGAVRRNGVITKVPVGYKNRSIPFEGGGRLCMTIPWGDVSTAYHSTGIPDIEVYTATSKKQLSALRWTKPFLPLLAVPQIRGFVRDQIGARSKGPSEQAQSEAKMQLWGEAATHDGKRVEATMTTPEGYRLTALAALAAVEKVTQITARGALTPSKAFGAEFAESLPGVTLRFREGK